MRILIIEDEPKTGAYLKKGLEESGYSVDVGNDGADGLLLAQEQDYDAPISRVSNRQATSRSLPMRPIPPTFRLPMRKWPQRIRRSA